MTLDEIEGFILWVNNAGPTAIERKLSAAIEELLPIVKAAEAWRRSGGHPCGEPHCGCTECRLWDAIDTWRKSKP